MITLQKYVGFWKNVFRILIPDKFKEKSPSFMKFGWVTKMFKAKYPRGTLSPWRLIRVNNLLKHYCSFRFLIYFIFCLIKSIYSQDPSTAVFKTKRSGLGLLLWFLFWKSECNRVCKISRFHVIKFKVLRKTLPYEELESCCLLITS